MPWEELLKDPNYEVISNVYQRNCVGGRPALIIRKARYHIQNLTNSVVQIPWGVEAVWAVLSPIEVHQDSLVKKIVCCALYSKPDSKKKSLLLDHILETF